MVIGTEANKSFFRIALTFIIQEKKFGSSFLSLESTTFLDSQFSITCSLLTQIVYNNDNPVS